MFNTTVVVDVAPLPINSMLVLASSIVGGTRVNNLSIWLTIDKNIKTQNIIKSKIARREITMVVPWVFQSIVLANQGTNQSLQLQITDAFRKVLQKIYYSTYIANGVNNLAYNKSNINGAIATEFNTFLNGN